MVLFGFVDGLCLSVQPLVVLPFWLLFRVSGCRRSFRPLAAVRPSVVRSYVQPFSFHHWKSGRRLPAISFVFVFFSGVVLSLLFSLTVLRPLDVLTIFRHLSQLSQSTSMSLFVRWSSSLFGASDRILSFRCCWFIWSSMSGLLLHLLLRLLWPFGVNLLWF